ncbi:sugar phosphate isomerase/epimerase [Humidesulfovibrio sp.]|uniref:sugar phosphate isomerase/epimerase family protein n=1 Tax=Humidesulfovibrio sp. TaxID=2910988 RepID=UPI002736108B|nr:sugar phosphate isomerase/epimerase [Humidesulfovibrio sp.]
MDSLLHTSQTDRTCATAQALLSTGSLFHLPLPTIARIAQAAGFAGLDLVMGSPKIAPGPAVDEAHALCPVRVVHAPFRNWSAWGGHMDAWRAAVHLASGLRCDANGQAVHVTLHPPAGTLRDAIQTRWFARAVDLPRLLGAPAGISLSLENLPWAGSAGAFFGRDNLTSLLEQCREKDLGLTLDVCHLGVSGRDVLEDLERIPAGPGAELIRHVHFSDASGFTEHLPPGAGELPLGPFLARLGARGYAGTVSLELDPAHLPEEEAGQVRSLAALRQAMECALAGDPPPSWAGRPGERRAQQAMAALG